MSRLIPTKETFCNHHLPPLFRVSFFPRIQVSKFLRMVIARWERPCWLERARYRSFHKHKGRYQYCMAVEKVLLHCRSAHCWVATAQRICQICATWLWNCAKSAATRYSLFILLAFQYNTYLSLASKMDCLQAWNWRLGMRVISAQRIDQYLDPSSILKPTVSSECRASIKRFSSLV